MKIQSERDLIDLEIELDGDKWTVGNVGIVSGDMVYCHLWSLTRTLLTQSNGRKIPVQSCRFVPLVAFGDDAMSLVQLYT